MRLTPKQRAVIDLLVQGKTPKEAAAILNLKNESVTESRLRRARYVNNSRTTVQLVCRYLVPILLACPCFAGDYWMLTKTNLAEFPTGHVLMDGTNIVFLPKGLIERKSCPELSTYTITGTNWSDAAIIEVGGVKKVQQVANLITNRTLHVEFEGKTYLIPLSQTLGPEVMRRDYTVPTPIRNQVLPLRQNR